MVRLPRLPKVRMPKVRRRTGAHAIGARPDQWRPAVPEGGSSRSAWRTEPAYVGRHAPGKHRRKRPMPPPSDPFLTSPPPPGPPAHVPTVQRPQPVMGQPAAGSGKGDPRKRFGPAPQVKITDLAPAYRASGQPARTPAEQRAHDLSRDALIKATKAAQRARGPAAARGAIEHEPAAAPARQRASQGTTYRSTHAGRTVATAPRPRAALPGDPANLEARQRARAAARKGTSGRDPNPRASHPYFSGGTKAAPHVRMADVYGPPHTPGR